jgi:hypothetical protein
VRATAGSNQDRGAKCRKIALVFQHVAVGHAAAGRTIQRQVTEGQPVVVTGGQPEGEIGATAAKEAVAALWKFDAGVQRNCVLPSLPGRAAMPRETDIADP